MARSAVREKAKRLAEIPRLLQIKERTTQELAMRLGAPLRAIQRDLEDLREEGLGIEQVRRGVYRMPNHPSSLTAMEAAAVHAAVRLLYHHSPAPNRHYRSALEKLAVMLPEPARSMALKASEDFGRGMDDRSLELAARAWFERKVLAGEYQSASGSRSWRAKEIEVYFIEINRENLSPYIVGYERSYHQRVLTFKLSRLRNTRLLDQSYAIPAHFSPQKFFSTAWGVWGGEKTLTVKLRFSPQAAFRIREGGYRHLQTLHEDSQGLVVSVQAPMGKDGLPTELIPWIRGWGGEVEVLEPARLREHCLAEAQRVAQLYHSAHNSH